MPTALTILLARLPEPATEYDYHSRLTSVNPVGLTTPTPVGDDGVYLIRTNELRVSSLPIPEVVLSGLVPRAERTHCGGHVLLAESTVLGRLVPCTEYAAFRGLPLTSTVFHDFLTQEPRIGIDGLSAASPGISVARFSASVATTEGCTGCGSISPAADTGLCFFMLYILRAAQALQKPWLQ